MSSQLPRWVGTLLGIILCGGLSAIAALAFASRPSRTLVPLAFVAVIVAMAVRYGAAAGIYGSLVAAFVFALLLFEPLHNVHIQSSAAKANIGWMVLAGVSLSFLLSRPSRTPYKKN